MNIEYKTSVKTQAGFRSVYVKAKAKKISEKRVEVLELLSIDDEAISSNMSRTGANRQRYNGNYLAQIEQGKIKNISSLYDYDDK